MAAASAQICALLMFIQVSLALQYWDQGCPAIVAAGSHEKTSPAPNFQFRTDAIIGTKVVFDSSKTARYLFAADNTKGFYCSSSWNKGFGASRCGSTNFHHQDSDRFVWRRSPECIVQGANGTMSEMVPGTPGFANSSCGQNNYLDYVEIAAYAYDDGRKPFENTPELLKVFKTRMRVGSRYAWKISDGGRNVTYDLFDANMTLLESQIITHRSCDSSGYFTGWYFGGQCPAPQDVSACFSAFSDATTSYPTAGMSTTSPPNTSASSFTTSSLLYNSTSTTVLSTRTASQVPITSASVALIPVSSLSLGTMALALSVIKVML